MLCISDYLTRFIIIVLSAAMIFLILSVLLASCSFVKYIVSVFISSSGCSCNGSASHLAYTTPSWFNMYSSTLLSFVLESVCHPLNIYPVFSGTYSVRSNVSPYNAVMGRIYEPPYEANFSVYVPVTVQCAYSVVLLSYTQSSVTISPPSGSVYQPSH